jgi:hypothetical protein
MRRIVSPEESCSWVLVVGMHRSGTSCLAGILGACGAHLGDVATWAPHNAKGTRELEPVWRLNDDVLAASGGSWHDVPAAVTWTSEHRRRRDEILSSLAASRQPVICIKDPRLLLTLDLWLEPLPPESVRVVGSVRKPAAVARSLQVRNGFDRRHALRLWRAYNTRLLKRQQHRPDGIVDFSQQSAEYLRHVQSLVQRLGLRWSDDAEAFFDDDLRASESTSRWIPLRDRRLYATLHRLAKASVGFTG